ncbi:hypothetical protein [Vibrio phage YC]|uniref:Uncharacterized protein n=1 Tax=Vibrio phage YC TaxID=2267403 RepID=A0A384ZS55_9CAUD|nr:hypothetical protein HWB64_gp099 [Vibrio phage YC]AXC34468.1 hypothetical protein [Vibrio phage YC]QJT71367.1 hypothetical protein GR28A_00079 [Vibrio phage vB_VcorM_GR28A]
MANKSFNLVKGHGLTPEMAIEAAKKLGLNLIQNGPAHTNPLSEETTYLMTILDGTTKDWQRLRRCVALRSFAIDKVIY